MMFGMLAHIQGFLNHYNIKLRLEIVVYCLVPLWPFEPRWTGMTVALHGFLSVLCPDCNSVCRLRCEKSWRVCLRWISTLSRDQLLIEKNRFLRCIMMWFDWIWGISFANQYLLYQHPLSPYPNNLSRTRWERGFWVGVKLVKCRKK